MQGRFVEESEEWVVGQCGILVVGQRRMQGNSRKVVWGLVMSKTSTLLNLLCVHCSLAFVQHF